MYKGILIILILLTASCSANRNERRDVLIVSDKKSYVAPWSGSQNMDFIHALSETYKFTSVDNDVFEKYFLINSKPEYARLKSLSDTGLPYGPYIKEKKDLLESISGKTYVSLLYLDYEKYNKDVEGFGLRDFLIEIDNSSVLTFPSCVNVGHGQNHCVEKIIPSFGIYQVGVVFNLGDYYVPMKQTDAAELINLSITNKAELFSHAVIMYRIKSCEIEDVKRMSVCNTEILAGYLYKSKPVGGNSKHFNQIAKMP